VSFLRKASVNANAIEALKGLILPEIEIVFGIGLTPEGGSYP